VTKPISILVGALGGEGGGVLAEWLVAAATRAGYAAQSTSIPGVAQRTGATTYYVEIYPEPIAALAGRRPVLSLLPVPGGVDLVVASELLEAVRAVQNGMVSAERTTLIASLGRTLTTAEKMPLGDGRFDSELLHDVARRHSRNLVAFDMAQLTRDAGTVVSAVMCGAIAASGALPFDRGAFETVIRDSGRDAAPSLAGFARAWDATRAAMSGTGSAAGGAITAPARPMPPTAAWTDALRAAFPAATHEFIEIGYARLRDYQDRAYADLYVERLARILVAERQADVAGAHDFALTRETARFLALWMAFDDIVRVADLKCRASRFARVRSEVTAGPRDIVRIVDYFKPGVPELASLLPRALASRLVAWDRRRQARGKPPLSFALTLATDSVAGFVALRALAGLSWVRRHGVRFAEEQTAIERWLAAILTAARDDWQLALEIALCGRLIKGYGATSERGKENLRHILGHLAGNAALAVGERALAVRAAREAALADEAGTALDQALVAHGAPPRPVKAEPIVWAKRPSAARASRVEHVS
jgi:indolepyruvate ferredoxin oxidoreductase beta subunit